MGLIIGLMKWYAIGVCFVLVLPMFARAMPWRFASSLIDPYVSMAMSLINRGLFLERSHGGHRLVRTQYSSKKGGETKKMGGEEQVWTDPNNYMTTLKSRSFGLAHEDSNIVTDARMAFLGRKFRELKETGRWMLNDHRKRYFEIEPDPELVKIRDAGYIRQGSARPDLIDRVWAMIEKAYALYDTSAIAERLMWLAAFGTGLGGMFLAAEFATRTAGATNPIPIYVVGVLPL